MFIFSLWNQCGIVAFTLIQIISQLHEKFLMLKIFWCTLRFKNWKILCYTNVLHILRNPYRFCRYSVFCFILRPLNLKTVKWENILAGFENCITYTQWFFTYLATPSHLYSSHSKNNFACTKAGSWTLSGLIEALFFKDYTTGSPCDWNIENIYSVLGAATFTRLLVYMYWKL